MNLQQLHEMGAAAVCPKCGQGPMSKTHFWYKGGWQCKKGATPPPAPIVSPATSTTPTTTAVPLSRTAPPAAPTARAPLTPIPKPPGAQSLTPGQLPVSAQRKMLESFLTKLGVTKFTINPDLSVDVDGSVSVNAVSYVRIPCKFKKVTGSFRWVAGKLTSLENAPDEVGEDFDVHANQLKSLDGMPSSIGGIISLAGNQLTTWKGLPAKTNSDLYAYGNPAADVVEHLPAEVNGSLTIGSTNPWSLRGIHKKTKVDGEIIVTGSLTDGGLGLLMVKGLTEVDASVMSDKAAEKAFTIINNALKAGEDVLDVQEKLIDAGMSQYAKL